MNWRKPLIYLLLYATGSKIPGNLKTIHRLSRAPREEVLEYQKEKLKRLLRHAHDYVPYYSKVLKEAGVVQDGQVFLEHFESIPLLTKDIIRKQGSNLHSRQKQKGVYENTSGGSTGEPVRFLQDKHYNEWNIANKIYYKSLAGQDIGNSELRFWGSERDLLEGKESLKIRLRNFLYNRKEFNTFRMTEKHLHDYFKWWNQLKPDWVESYVQSIFEFSKFILKNRIQIYSPKNGVLSSAGTLYPEMKKSIEKAFQCKVYNRYGSREVGDIAFGQDKLEISNWNQKLELFETTDSEFKKIIITNLNNFIMPLIRYDIGDLAERGEHRSCLNRVIGRTNHLIKTSQGAVDSAAITSALYFDLDGNLFTSFSKYQLIQEEKNSFVLKIVVADHDKWIKDKKSILKVMQSILGNDITFKFEEVEYIEELGSGKYEYIKSDIK